MNHRLLVLDLARIAASGNEIVTETETCYAQMEKEMLAIAFAVEKFNDYTFGNKTIVFSDKPLESILKKPLHRALKRAFARHDNLSSEA